MKEKEEKGITLVALIITIIILVILAAVTIRVVFKNRMIDIATEGVENYTKASYEEVDKLEDLSEKLDEAVDKLVKVKLTRIGEVTTDSVEVETTIDGNLKDIYSYTFQKSLTGKNEEFETEEEVVSSNKNYTYKYKTLKPANKNYLRVIITYNGGKTKISNVVEVLTYCKTTLCEATKVNCSSCGRCRFKWWKTLYENF